MGQKRYLEIGKITNVHGLAGEVKVYPWCDDAAFLCSFDVLYTDRDGKHPVTVERARIQQNMVIMKLADVASREAAEKLRGTILYMDREDVELKEDCYFVQDLIGLEVIDADTGRVWGRIRDVMQTGANDVYSIWNAQEQREYLAPAIPDVVLETNIEAGTMTIRPLEGLFDAD
ncbi:MAG: ribosome maturation factor RimM [Oscillospiraceae bacterium]|nr:ribosome maturation factor RimM [Oscillospiraceae bacterium]